ncbi:MAG TPA: hypothetical protein VK961_01220 [Chthoniobacter sp.]|nr:hypothetical protein [Chthoniobacter sp.]
MPIFDLFSKRQKRLRGDTPDVYVYDEIPQQLRVQIVHILRDAFGPPEYSQYGGKNPVIAAFDEIHGILCREYGVFSLAKKRDDDGWDAVTDFILSDENPERVLDALELCIKYVDKLVRGDSYKFNGVRQNADEAITELNRRFLEHSVGFQYESENILRIDSQVIHAEVVRPALAFLADSSFKGPNEEFLKAHEHYRAGRTKECIAECLKAFESTMKTICGRRKWTYKPTDTAKPLIDVLFAQKLIPEYLQSEFGALRTILESGIPTLRNKTSGHGQGPALVNVPSYFVSYVLHLTASTILFLCEADKNLK